MKKAISIILSILLIICNVNIVSAKNNENLLRYGEYEKAQTVATEYVTKTTVPEGQLPTGINMRTGGSVYVDFTKGSSISIGIGASWGHISVSISVGFASESPAAYAVNIPADNHYYRIKADQTYKIEHRKVDVYQYGQYQYTYYHDLATLDSASLYLVMVK